MKKITSEDVDLIVGIADQFLEDWRTSDTDQPESDRDPALPERENEWDTVRPLLVAAPQLADMVEQMLALIPEKDATLRSQADEMLKRLEAHRTFGPGHAPFDATYISVEAWDAVLKEGLEPGAKWRACIVIDGPDEGRDAFFWRDTEAQDSENGPFVDYESCVTDALKNETIDPSRLTRHCGLDRRTANAVLAFEARCQIVAPREPTADHHGDTFAKPDWDVVQTYFGLDESFVWTDAHISDYTAQYISSNKLSQ